MAIKKKKIGLIIGSGELATYCMEELVHLGYETTIVRLPCSRVRIKKNLEKVHLNMIIMALKNFTILKQIMRKNKEEKN